MPSITKNIKHKQGSYETLLPGGAGLSGLGRESNALSRRRTAYVILLAFCMAALFLSVLITESPTFDTVQGRTIQSYQQGFQQQGDEMMESNIGNITEEIEQVLEEQRRLIADEMFGYVYGKHKLNISALADMIPESGGRPLRSVIVTTWRSGSTFLGDVLNSHPGNWYHYEPLLDFDIMQVRGSPHAAPAISALQQLLQCNYTGLDHYLEFGKRNNFLFTHNQRLWSQCEAHRHLCWRSEFLTPLCRLFPAQSMKIVRLRLRLAEELLRDRALGVKMLLMVRDPRGTMQSRRHREWCPGKADCSDPQILCSDLADDYYAAVRIARKYPDSFRVMRYEDLSLDPYKVVRELFSFFNLNFHPAVRLFLDTHTTINVGGVSSTYRDSKSAPFHWRNDFQFEEVQLIQEKCTEAMQLWGYLNAKNVEHMREFNPLASYRLR